MRASWQTAPAVALVWLIALPGLVAPARGATFTVDVLHDGTDADPADGLCLTAAGDCTLRAAVQQANTTSNPPHTILLPLFGIYTLDTCCFAEDDGAEGDLDVHRSLEIIGIRPDLTVIEQTVDDRTLQCETDSGFLSLTLRNLTITGGGFNNSFVNIPEDGGALHFRACNHTLDNVVVTGGLNRSAGVGCSIAAINSNSTIRRSTLALCSGFWGGTLYLQNGVLRTALIEESTILSNTSLEGAIYLAGATDLTVRNSTVSANSKANIEFGGGQTLTLEHVTLYQEGDSTGVRFSDSYFGGTMTVTNSLFQHASPTGNCDMGLAGITISEGYNIDSSNTCQLTSLTDSINTDALLDNIADNGGPTMTHGYTATRSPAIDYVPAAHGVCFGSGATIDQRGAPRLGGCDAGAYEYLGCPTLTLSGETIFGNTEYHECAITVGPDLTVVGPGGELTLTVGSVAKLDDGFALEADGRLAVFHDPSLQLVDPELVEAEQSRRSVDTLKP